MFSLAGQTYAWESVRTFPLVLDIPGEADIVGDTMFQVVLTGV